MAAPKYLAHLYKQGSSGQEEDKKVIEALKQRLNDKLLKDPEACKKAALIIENWLQHKPKK